MEPVEWIILIVAVVGAIAVAASMPHPPQQKPAALDDFGFPQFEEGTAQCVVFGDCWCPDWFVLAYGDYRVEEIPAKGGK